MTSDKVDDLRQLATEVRDFIQTKVGVTDFSRVWESLRRHTSERREGRRQAKNQLVRPVDRPSYDTGSTADLSPGNTRSESVRREARQENEYEEGLEKAKSQGICVSSDVKSRINRRN